MAHLHPVQVYYEDTDHSGVVYHANYLKFMERAREHLLGVQALVEMFEHDGTGFVVHKCALQYLEGARFGEALEVRTTVVLESAYRASFQQDVARPGASKPIVKGQVELCCVDGRAKLTLLPEWVADRLRATQAYRERSEGHPAR